MELGVVLSPGRAASDGGGDGRHGANGRVPRLSKPARRGQPGGPAYSHSIVPGGLLVMS